MWNCSSDGIYSTINYLHRFTDFEIPTKILQIFSRVQHQRTIWVNEKIRSGTMLTPVWSISSSVFSTTNPQNPNMSRRLYMIFNCSPVLKCCSIMPVNYRHPVVCASSDNLMVMPVYVLNSSVRFLVFPRLLSPVANDGRASLQDSLCSTRDSAKKRWVARNLSSFRSLLPCRKKSLLLPTKRIIAVRDVIFHQTIDDLSSRKFLLSTGYFLFIFSALLRFLEDDLDHNDISFSLSDLVG